MRTLLIAATALVITGFCVPTPVRAESSVERLLSGDRESSGSSREQREQTADDCARLRHENRELEERRDYARYHDEREDLERKIHSIHEQLDRSCGRR
jgi:hypothetical protein